MSEKITILYTCTAVKGDAKIAQQREALELFAKILELMRADKVTNLVAAGLSRIGRDWFKVNNMIFSSSSI